MATLYVTEYEDLGQAAYVNALREPRVANQTLTIGSSAVSSSAFQSQTRLIRIFADSTCCVEIGVISATNSATVGTSQRLATGIEYVRAVPPKTSFQISVIGST